MRNDMILENFTALINNRKSKRLRQLIIQGGNMKGKILSSALSLTDEGVSDYWWTPSTANTTLNCRLKRPWDAASLSGE